jgi:hypothetical protein
MCTSTVTGGQSQQIKEKMQESSMICVQVHHGCLFIIRNVVIREYDKMIGQTGDGWDAGGTKG